MPVSGIGEGALHIAPMKEKPKTMEMSALLDAVRGGSDPVGNDTWAAWAERLDDWVEAYPAFGAGRMLRAKTARETRSLAAADRLAQAAVFSSEPGRLFDLLFRAGIESEIASFARAVEALEPEVEEAIRLKWHPDQTASPEMVTTEEAEEAEAPEEQEASVSDPVSESPTRVIPEEGSLAREVVLGAIERSIEREIEEVRKEEAEAAAPALEVSEKVPDSDLQGGPVLDVGALSPLARWAYERSRDTGFIEAAEQRMPSVALRQAAEKMESVMGGVDGEVATVPEGGLEQQAALIDLFIRNEPTIGPIRPEVERPTIKELAKESLVEDASLITETMARIYASQGQLGRARRAYKLLSLKYPEKSVYFAAQSKKLGRKGSDD